MKSTSQRARRTLCAILASLLLATPLASCVQGGGNTDPTADDTTAVTAPSTEAPTETEAETEAPDLSLKLVVDGQSDYTVVYGSETTRIAGYTLRDTLSQHTGAVLPVKSATELEEGNKFYITLHSDVDNELELGNYGYSLAIEGTGIHILANSLAGFDMAITRLLAD